MPDRFIWRIVYCALIVLSLFIAIKTAEAQPRADVCMAVGLDASGSIDDGEMRLQLEGLALALTHPRFMRALRSGRHGLIAIAVFTWADGLEGVRVVVPWFGIAAEKEAQAVALALREHAQPHAVRSTSLLIAIQAGARALAECPWFADRQLLNVAGDGHTNIGPSPAVARDMAIERGIVINGLVVGGDPAALAHYEAEVIGPAGVGFVVDVPTFERFADAMLNKLLLELAAAPIGTSTTDGRN
ncbi:MAG: DUF1194 domain-containing protein [Inquilinus sp.]|nr:DUF1194 domain-containing protein [Inquilinus sp.]